MEKSEPVYYHEWTAFTSANYGVVSFGVVS